jgi:hypothetical protein
MVAEVSAAQDRQRHDGLTSQHSSFFLGGVWQV